MACLRPPSECALLTASACSILAGLGALAVSIVFGIYALVPDGPWSERDIVTGVCLIVFSSFISASVSAIVYVCLACICNIAEEAGCVKEDSGV